jgi:rubrerythrin
MPQNPPIPPSNDDINDRKVGPSSVPPTNSSNVPPTPPVQTTPPAQTSLAEMPSGNEGGKTPKNPPAVNQQNYTQESSVSSPSDNALTEIAGVKVYVNPKKSTNKSTPVLYRWRCSKCGTLIESFEQVKNCPKCGASSDMFVDAD